MCMSSCGCLLSDQKIISFAVSVSELLIFASLLTGWLFLSGKRHSRLYILQSLRSHQHLHCESACGAFKIPHYKVLKLCEQGLSTFIPAAQTLFKGFRSLSYLDLGQFLFVIFLRGIILYRLISLSTSKDYLPLAISFLKLTSIGQSLARDQKWRVWIKRLPWFMGIHISFLME